MKWIEIEFSLENFLSLGKACYELGKKVEELFYVYEYDTMIVPSRGACPLAEVSIGIRNYIANQQNEESRLKNVVVSSILKNYPGFEDFQNVLNAKKDKMKKILVIPLTADIGVEPELIDENKISVDKFNEKLTDEIRRYGANLINAFYLDKRERVCDPTFKFFHFLLKEVEGRNELAEEYLNFPKIENAFIIDTVISGRAFTTIINNLEKLNRDVYSLVVIDENGRKLKENYESKLKKLFWQNKLFVTKTNRILSEDRGAGLLGVSAYIYPNFMVGKFKEYIKNYISDIGPVTWHPLPKNERYEKVFYSFEKALFEATKVAWAEDEAPRRVDGYIKTLEKIRKRFIKNLEEYNVLKVPDIVNGFPKIPVQKVTESSSHVIHIYFSEREMEKLLRKYQQYAI
jgi:hypothetical protein